jgi:hypothetical protein
MITKTIKLIAYSLLVIIVLTTSTSCMTTKTSVSTPVDGNCQVITRFSFVDFLISGLTGGIVRTETIKVKAKKN